jgi:hypothetical protein
VSAARARLADVSPAVWLTALVVGSVALRMLLAGRTVSPWIMVDELIYSELGKSLGASGEFLVRGVPSTGYGFVYPVLLAPAFRLFDSVPDAYHAAKLINAVVMSLTAVPVYFLARRLLTPGLSLAAATLSVLLPSMLYTETLMTENAFYPLFALASLVFVLTLERPTALRQLLLIAVCALCFAARAQAVALFGAAVIAPVLHGLIERDLGLRLRRFVTLYGIAGAAVLLGLVGTVARGRSPLSLLGAYQAATGSDYSASEVGHYLLWHAAELDLYLGVVGVAALIAMWLAPRGLTPGARAFVAATLPITVLLVAEVAVFASRQSGRIEERNAFYIAPFVLIALVGMVSREPVVPAARRTRAIAAVIAGVLPLAVPFARFVNTSAVSDTLGLLPWWWLQDQGIHFGPLRVVALGVGLAAGAAFVFVPRRYAWALPVLVGAYLVMASIVVENGRHGIRQASAGALFAGIRLPHPDWIDRRVGRDADVSFLWHYTGETRPLWNNEFFNRSVHDVYTVDGPDPADGGLPETPVFERGDGTLVDAARVAPRVRYAVSYVDIAGTPLERDAQLGLTLYRVGGPMVILTRVRGVYPDTWGGRTVTYRRARCRGGTVSVRLGTDEHLFHTAQVVTARENGRVVARRRIEPAEQPTLVVPLRPNGRGECTVIFTASGLRTPGQGDQRRLGAHYYSFDYHR